MAKKFIVHVLRTTDNKLASFRSVTVDEADLLATHFRCACGDRSKYLITVCHEDEGLLGTF